MQLFAVIPQPLGILDSPIHAGLTITGSCVLGLNSSVFQPAAGGDSTTFVQIKNAAGTQVVGVDTTNGRVMFGPGSPASLVELKSNSADTYLRINTRNVSRKDAGIFILSLGTGDVNRGGFIGYDGGDNTFKINGIGSSGADHITIDPDGNVGFNEIAPETQQEMTSAEPYLTLHNSTHEDTDGGGEVRIIGKREDGAGTETAAGQIEISHDGSGANDQLGKIVLSVNTGAGLVQALELGSDLSAAFAGVVQATDFAKTGWPVTPGVTLSFVNGTRTFTVTDGGSAFYYVDGIKYILGGNKTVVIDDTEGLWYIYFVGSTLTASQTPWAIRDEDKALVSILYWDATNNEEIYLGNELHTFHMSGATHERLHNAGGTAFESGLLVADAGSETVNVDAGTIHDEDLEVNISDGVGGGLFEQVLSPAELPIYYRDGASDWRIFETGDKANATDVGFVDGTNNLEINQLNGTWATVNVGAAKHVAYWVIATDDQTSPVALIMGQREDTTLANARENNLFSGLSLSGLPIQEMVLVARLILKETGGGIFYTLEEVLDLRGTNIGGNITSPLITQHAGLGGLAFADAGHSGFQAQGDVLDDLNTLGVSTADGEFLVATGAGALDWESGATARTSLGVGTGVVQVVNTQTGAVNTGTTQMPEDDSIPQITEGDEYMTLAITPTSATNKLKIDVVVVVASSIVNQAMSVAIFQDTTANALAAVTQRMQSSANFAITLGFSHYMAAGTTNSTTFKVRIGGEDPGTTTFNGSNAGRFMGGVMASSITITEIYV